jgi:hypothetical protein
MTKYWKSGLSILLLLLVCVPASIFLLTPGFYEPHDLHHIADIYEMFRAFASGQIPPRLGPDYIFGYGYPLFNFYYPLPFYLGSLFFSLIGSLTVSYKLVFISVIVISVLGMYLLLKEFLDKWGAFVGSFLFLYTPYRAVQIYVRGAMGEALALSLFPIFTWAIIRVLKKPNIKTSILAGIIGSIFILSHNYFWALSALWLVTLIFVVKYKNRLIILVKLVLAGIIALAISAYWWLPALIEQKLVSATTPFPLIDHFPFIKQLIIPFWGYGASLWGPGDGMSFQIGVVNLAVTTFLVIFLIFGYRKLKNRSLLNLSIWVIAGILINIFMMNVRSYPIWKLMPFYDFIQFPWRLLSFTAFFTAIAAGIAVSMLSGKKKYVLGLLIVGASLFLTWSYFRPSQKFYKSDDAYLHRFFANRSIEGQTKGVSEEYLLYSEDYLQLPNWVSVRPKDIAVPKISSTDLKVSEVTEVNPVHWEGNVELGKLGTVIFHEMYFPGWVAEIDGKIISITSDGPNGEITVKLEGQGTHKLEFFWQETPLRKTADIISLVAFVAAIGIFILPIKKK